MLVDHASSSVADARQHLARELDRLHVARAAIEDAVLVLSELISNAIKHARPLGSGQVAVKWKIMDGDDRTVWIGVTDGGSHTRPVPERASASALGGRGLSIVSVLSRDWGVEDGAPGTTVWAVVGLVSRRPRWSAGPSGPAAAVS